MLGTAEPFFFLLKAIMYNIPEHVVKHGPWSISKAGLAAKCSLEFDYKYGTQPIKLPDETAESRLGEAVHYALELSLDETVSVGRAMAMSSDRYELTVDECEHLETFREQIERFTKKMQILQQKHAVHPANRFIERKWGIRRDFTGCSFFEDGKGDCIECGEGRKEHQVDRAACLNVANKRYRGSDGSVFFRGVVDLGLLTAKRDLIIIDHKSGKERELSYYEAQFKAYCLMALANIPNLRGVQTAVNFVMSDKLQWDSYITAEKIKNDYQPWLIDHLIKSCEKLLTPPTPTVTRLCDWCIYKKMKICPAFGGMGRASQETK